MTSIGTKQANSTITNKAKCPRCGYDLRGTIETWAKQCSLLGKCTECGFDFQWAELLSKTVSKPKWCVEFFSNYRNHFVRSIKTLFVTFIPWKFWGSLKMSHEISWRAIVAYLGILMISLYVLLSLCNGVTVHGLTSTGGRYSILTFRLGTPINTPATDHWKDIFSSTLLPLSSRNLANVPFSPFGVAAWKFSYLIKILPVMLISNLLCGAGFLALPVTRRIAKVRWCHVYRIIIYEIAFAYPFIVLGMLGVAIGEYNNTLVEILSAVLIFVSSIGLLLYYPAQIFWWSLAAKRYLRMRHAWGIGIAVVIMSGLTIWTASLIYFNLTYTIGT